MDDILLCVVLQYVFVTEFAPDNTKTIHEQLSKYLMTSLKPGADPAVVNNLMKVTHLIHCHIFLISFKNNTLKLILEPVVPSLEAMRVQLVEIKVIATFPEK